LHGNSLRKTPSSGEASKDEFPRSGNEGLGVSCSEHPVFRLTAHFYEIKHHKNISGMRSSTVVERIRNAALSIHAALITKG